MTLKPSLVYKKITVISHTNCRCGCCLKTVEPAAKPSHDARRLGPGSGDAVRLKVEPLRSVDVDTCVCQPLIQIGAVTLRCRVLYIKRPGLYSCQRRILCPDKESVGHVPL